MRTRITLLILILPITALLAGCPDQSNTLIDDGQINASQFDWGVPRGIPLPIEPSDNPMTEAKFELGRHLFYDARLSANNRVSCGSCHHQDKAFADGRRLPRGATDEIHPRNSQALVNVAWNASLTWGNPILHTIEQQVVIPLFGEEPVEHGINDANKEHILFNLEADTAYGELFSAAFPDDEHPITYQRIVQALSSFVRGLISFDSPVDRFNQGDTQAITPAAKRGMDLFFSERLECFHCHGGYNFTNSVADRTQFFIDRPFHNTGLYNIDGLGSYPFPNTGVHEITDRDRDMGRFRAPSLRNVAVTAPYTHDGSVATLGEMIDIYAAGGRNISGGPNSGDGRMNPNKDGFVVGFTLSPAEKADLIAFLESLTDEGFLTNPRFANPWPDSHPSQPQR